MLIVAGKFDPDKTLGLIAKYFGPIPKPARTLPTIYTVEPVQDGERTVTLRRVGNTQIVGLMYHTVRGSDPDYVATDVLGDVMTLAPSGRMYKALVETKKASSVGSDAAELARPRPPHVHRRGARRPPRSTPRATRCSRRWPPSRRSRSPKRRSRGSAPAPRSTSTTPSTTPRPSASRSPNRSRSATGGCSSSPATATARSSRRTCSAWRSPISSGRT